MVALSMLAAGVRYFVSNNKKCANVCLFCRLPPPVRCHGERALSDFQRATRDNKLRQVRYEANQECRFIPGEAVKKAQNDLHAKRAYLDFLHDLTPFLFATTAMSYCINVAIRLMHAGNSNAYIFVVICVALLYLAVRAAVSAVQIYAATAQLEDPEFQAKIGHDLSLRNLLRHGKRTAFDALLIILVAVAGIAGAFVTAVLSTT